MKRTQTRIFRKSGSRTFRKSGPYTKIQFKNSLLTNSRVLVSNMTIVFKVLAQKYPSKAFLVPNLGIFIHLDKFEGVDFKCDNSF